MSTRGWEQATEGDFKGRLKVADKPRRTPQVERTVPSTQFDPFVLLLRAEGLPEPETEVIFAPPRKFQADYCWRVLRVIVEREGGIWSKDERAKAAHAKPLKIMRDMEKSNLAQAQGWIYLRFTPTELDKGEAIQMIREVLTWRGCRREA